MTFLPIIGRELRVASRKPGIYLSRTLAALIGVIIAGWILGTLRRESSAQVGMALFIGLTVLSVIFAALAGCRVTADSLSEEKREGTLGLLFLTDLKGYDVIFGKLFANSISAFYSLMAFFPVLAIPMLMGGVTYNEFWRVVLVAINLLFLSLSVGMFVSAMAKDERKAMGGTLLILILLYVCAPGLGLYEFFQINNERGPFPMHYMAFTPAFSAFGAFEVFYFSKGDLFWKSIMTTQVLAWAFLSAACLIVPHSWQDRPASKRRLRWKDRQQAMSEGSALARTRRRSEMLEANPFYWLANRDRMKQVYVWLLLITIAAFWVWGRIKLKDDMFEEGMMVFTALASNAVIKVWLATEACRRFVADRRSGALELLLSTPFRVREILAGQWMALFKQFGLPVAALLVVDVIFLTRGLRDSYGGRIETEWLAMWICGMFIFLLDLVALGWNSMWQGMNARQSNNASGSAAARILVLPWFIFGLVMMCLGLMDAAPRQSTAVLCIWFIIAVGVDFYFIISCRRRLYDDFRHLATQRMAAPSGIRRQLIRRIFGGAAASSVERS